MQSSRVLRLMASAVLCIPTVGCSQGPREPTQADEDAYVRACFEASLAAAHQAGLETSVPIDEAISSLTPSQREQGIDVGMQDCATLRESVDEAVEVVTLGRALAADANNPGDPLDLTILAVRYLCPDLDDELDELRGALASHG